MLLKKKYSTEEKLKELDQEIKQLITQAADFAQQSPEPDENELWTDIYQGEAL